MPHSLLWGGKRAARRAATIPAWPTKQVPRYAPARIVQILKSISARELFTRFPRLRRRLWGGQLWEDGYFVRSVGDAVTAEIIRRYIRYQKHPQSVQLSLFDEGS